jgi:hypothetical protein
MHEDHIRKMAAYERMLREMLTLRMIKLEGGFLGRERPAVRASR